LTYQLGFALHNAFGWVFEGLTPLPNSFDGWFSYSLVGNLRPVVQVVIGASQLL
jgi:hypothetical protein